MASPPSFDFFSDALSDDADDSSAHRQNPNPDPHRAPPPTPNGLNDRLLRFTQTRPQNPNPSPPPQSDAPLPHDRKVKLAGRRRLCKLSSSPDPDADHKDEDSIRDILDDLTTRLDSLSVDRPKARPRPAQARAPLPCAVTAEDDAGFYDAASSSSSSSPPPPKSGEDDDGFYDAADSSSSSSPLPPKGPESGEGHVSTSDESEDEAPLVLRRQVKVDKPPQLPDPSFASSAFTDLAIQEEEEEESVDKGNSKPTPVVSKEIQLEKPQVPHSSFTSSAFAHLTAQEESVEKGNSKATAAAVRKEIKQEKPQVPDSPFDFSDLGAEEETSAKWNSKPTVVVKREVKVEKPDPDLSFASAFTDRRVLDDANDKGKKTASSAYGGAKSGKRAASKPSSFADFDEDEDGVSEEKENRAADDAGKDVGWEKTEDFKMEPTGCGKMVKPYKLPGSIFKMLYPHQREGLKWLWVLHCRGTGGILGDDMGLGKTMQVSAFLAGLFHCRLIKRVLVVAPKTLLTHWTKELSVVGLKHKIRDYSGASVNVRNSELQYAFKEGGILLTTYDIVRNNYKLIRGDFYNGNVEGKYDKLIRGDSYNDADEDEDGKLWNYVILDEGHIIKNPSTQRAKSLLEIPCVHRIVISGTPIQNNLKEMWALFYFCCPEVLGDKDEFKSRYESAIIRGNDKNATNREKHTGSTVAKALRERIKPYFLRRMKSEVFLDTGSADDKKLSKKNELIVWLRLTACQRQLYEAFLNSDLVHSSMQGSPLAAITVLKKICDHPLILTKRAAEGILEGMEGMLDNKDMGMVEKMAMNLADMAHDDQALQVGEEVSCKLIFIMSLLRKLLEEGHHVLIFSQTRKMLNLIQEAILLEGYKFLRIDGTTKIAERERIVKDFQEGPGAQIFLLTTQVGGLGLTLTKAARVIVVDPAWNPSTDNQSVDRAYRIGQTKDVIVYRLMTSGTIEEKIYKLQVFKGALFRTATEQKEQTRYFSKRDIQELFSLPEQGFDVSLTQKQLQEEHGQQLVMDESLREHIEFLERQGIAGVSHHSLLFSKTAVLPSLEPEAMESKHPTMPMMARQYNKASSMDYVANGAAHAFKPKDFTPRAYSASTTSSESPEEIKAKINRLSQTLSNTTLVSRLPDRGEKLKKQIHDLDEKLTVIESSPESSSMMSRGRAPEVICLDDQSL
ncbi:SNF2 domain-containing protein ENL1-like [Triticum urartu]|uniref:DNA excision repair protein ERCC-6-like protein n=1 Tax=Triticum urartu TaxID=4572 RepID=A0A8R7TPR8_TRIUA|nr:SNF2 domain-containing protein ENL1-like [Triticum urartu]